eukprot:GHVO01040937.1.p2 GENE.GHVO01040937.1~~GHVO01040937.1.p2  ORF type:complete len:142 (+),score=29.15 GHVO01040937.1:124-549(+)
METFGNAETTGGASTDIHYNRALIHFATADFKSAAAEFESARSAEVDRASEGGGGRLGNPCASNTHIVALYGGYISAKDTADALKKLVLTSTLHDSSASAIKTLLTLLEVHQGRTDIVQSIRKVIQDSGIENIHVLNALVA